LFGAKVLGKYDVRYFRCSHCCFIQTEEPYWLSESYEEAITDLDIGYVARNISLVEVVSTLIKVTADRHSKFLDYGGGYGLFVRMLRDKGFDFYRQDLHCKNIFSNHFDVTDLPTDTRFEMLTAFEVFEHLDNPMSEIEKMLSYADTLFFSTVLHPGASLTSAKDWWYFAPETGQHIAFYHRSTLEYIARKFECRLYSDGSGLHMFTKRKMLLNPVKLISRLFWFINKTFSRYFENSKGLIPSDSLIVREALHIKQAKSGIKIKGKIPAGTNVQSPLAAD
jgi:hypothetical protein